jgi:hypothetical protein
MNIVTSVLRFSAVHYGLGRHFKDPTINIPRFSYILWIQQIMNVLAVAVLKYSICAYLLALKFSKIYTAIIWSSLLMVTAFNLVVPVITFFSCTPFEANWNKGMKGKCVLSGSSAIVYTQVSQHGSSALQCDLTCRSREPRIFSLTSCTSLHPSYISPPSSSNAALNGACESSSASVSCKSTVLRAILHFSNTNQVQQSAPFSKPPNSASSASPVIHPGTA